MADFEVKFIKDSLDLKLYEVIDINNYCESDYSGFLLTKDISSQSIEIQLFYDELNLKLSGKYENGHKEGFWVEYFIHGQIDNKGNYSKGKRNGEWLWYFENGQVSSREIYSNDSVKSLEMWDENGTKLENPDKVTILPSLYEGDEDLNELRNLVVRELQYPESAAMRNASGTVFVLFCIDKNGNLYNERVAEGVDAALDAEALRVIRLAKRKWIPGKEHNRVKTMSIKFPIIFILN